MIDAASLSSLFIDASLFIHNGLILFLLLYAAGLALTDKRLEYTLYMLGLVVYIAILKAVFFHPRICISSLVECPSSSSFPSGHALLAYASAFFFARKKKPFLILFLLALLIAFSRILLGVHSFSEIAASLSFAFFYASIWWKYDKG